MSWFDQLRQAGDPAKEEARLEGLRDRMAESISKYCYSPHHAYHEAGHAVVAVHYGWPFERVWIARDSQLGAVEGIAYDPDDTTPAVVLFLAGPVAQAEYLGFDFWDLLKPQVDSTNPAIIADFDMIARILGKARVDIGQEDLREAQQIVTSILQERRELFEAVARRLMENHEISYAEVLELC